MEIYMFQEVGEGGRNDLNKAFSGFNLIERE